MGKYSFETFLYQIVVCLHLGGSCGGGVLIDVNTMASSDRVGNSACSNLFTFEFYWHAVAKEAGESTHYRFFAKYCCIFAFWIVVFLVAVLSIDVNTMISSDRVGK